MKSALSLPPAPYPGLRAFRPEESRIFCGRAEHRAEILDILSGARFLAVVGASGSGKSSLVFAGLLPDIREGQLIGLDPETVRMVSTQPGLRPFANLAAALTKELETSIELEPALRRGPLGLVQLLDEVENAPSRALVVLVDQFEEIFRFSDLSNEELASEGRSDRREPLLDGPQNEAQAFVNLLLATAQQDRHPVYVLLTMRSDFLPRCDQFTGLPEAISRSQFLTPRLNRQQLEQAITRPALLFGATIQPDLANLILNQISIEQDQLPLMQHALARMWTRKAPDVMTLSLDDYRAVGGLASALNNHCDSLCEDLGRNNGIALESIGRLFRSLAYHVGPNIPPVRRPARVAQIAEETGLSTKVVRTIANAFRAEGAHLLMPPVNKIAELADDTFLDISHESLLRQWTRLKEWMDAEWRQRRMAEELVASMDDWAASAPDEKKGPLAVLQSSKQAGEAVATRLYRDALPVFFSAKSPPTLPAWARRYGIDWTKLSAFCDRSFRWKRAVDISIKIGIGFAILLAVLIYAFAFVLYKNHAINEKNVELTRAKTEIENERDAARSANEKAQHERDAARAANEKAQQNYRRSVVESGHQQTTARADLQAQTKTLARVVAVLAKSASPAPEIQELLKDSQIQPFIPADLASPSPSPGLSTRQVVAGSGAPIQISLSSLGNVKAPVIAFLWNDREVLVICGAEKAPATDFWPLFSSTGLTPQRGASFESTALVSGLGSRDVLSFSADDRIRLIKGNGDPVVSGSCGALVTAARVVQQDPPQILFGTAIGHIGVWNGEAGAAPALFKTTHQGIVNGVDYSVAQRAVLASGDGNWARLWKLPATKVPLAALEGAVPGVDFPANAPIRQASFSPDGRLFVLPIGTTEAKLVSTQDPQSITILLHQDKVWRAKFSPDGRMLASCDRAGRVYLWDISEAPMVGPPVVLSGHSANLNVLLWSPQGDFLLSAGDDGLCIVWQRPKDRLAGTFNELPFLLPNHPGGVTGAAISPDGRMVATAGADGVARVYPVRPRMSGTFREWGGPKSPYDGDLALFNDSDINSPDVRNYFLPAPPAGTKGLIARLNPESFYVNARWDYTFTPRSKLRSTKMRLRKLDSQGQSTGPTIEAQPVDWGPPAQSGYTFDLSPGAIRALGLAKGDSVEMEIPLLESGTSPKKSAK